MKQDDCYEDEYFDADTQQCYFNESYYESSADSIDYEAGS